MYCKNTGLALQILVVFMSLTELEIHLIYEKIGEKTNQVDLLCYAIYFIKFKFKCFQLHTSSHYLSYSR